METINSTNLQIEQDKEYLKNNWNLIEDSDKEILILIGVQNE